MSPTVERANKVLMERPSSIPLLSRAIFGSSLLVNLLLVAAVAVFAVKWPADSPCPSAPLPATSLLEADYASKFVEWKVQFNKTFANFSEEARAFEAFAHAEDKINAHNAKNLNYRLGHNEFSHLPAEEFFAHRAGHLPSTHANHTRHPDRRIHTSNMIPTSTRRALKDGRSLTQSTAVDWVAAGAVTPVKNQGSCGSCWAFSATGAMEGMYYIAHNTLISFSEEDLIDCASTLSNGLQGCIGTRPTTGGASDQLIMLPFPCGTGGNPTNAFQWVIKNGIATEADYPYDQWTRSWGCDYSKTAYNIVAHTAAVHPNSRSALLEAVARGPVSIGLNSDNDIFQHYSGGVMDDTACSTANDHSVLVVGYDTRGPNPYWKVLASWPIVCPSACPSALISAVLLRRAYVLGTALGMSRCIHPHRLLSQIKNSYGTSWGEAGYIRLGMAGDGPGICGMYKDPSYPTYNS